MSSFPKKTNNTTLTGSKVITNTLSVSQVVASTLSASKITYNPPSSGSTFVSGSINHTNPLMTTTIESEEVARKDIMEILNGCAGSRTAEVVSKLLQLYRDRIFSEYRCLVCGSRDANVCGHVGSSKCWNPWSVGWTPKEMHESCEGCMCSCHEITDADLEPLKEKLLGLLEG